ncbi:conserved Plasmodium protein, unknown function [Plasmodium yoelii]|uniref:Uncharacterized protein n=2 Tax=Plasmodium yoelii TaxID=5861 RepID=A0AAF0B3S0_PLAYO|nr:conserved Plasmodium protein, unknown function [Plasmodium yoelii]WBY56010.1 hypothetical protein Py17XNL_000600691 [Plasmodium yoelii yoelii]VTZ75360.1 conserved Plasmodium protein, unknown function [Plasmodium yoelii]|eukprot:XP_022813167.2 conserved Plasmodium protein, unknown function [Plasmodium yoelii]
MESVDTQVHMNATLQKCAEMDKMHNLYNNRLIEQRERIESLKKKLNLYNKNIEQHESVFKNIIKYTDGFLSNIAQFLGNINYSKRLNMITGCAKYYLIDDKELNLTGNFNTVNHECKRCKCLKIQSQKSISNKCQNTIVYNKTSFYVEDNNKKKKKKKNAKKSTKKKSLYQNQNVYNLNNPYDTVEVKELYNIYRKQSLSSFNNYCMN